MNKKTIRAISLFAAGAMAALPVIAGAQSYTPGVYEQVVRGMGGKITFQIELSEDAIVSITPVKHHETEGIGDRAFENVIPAIIEAQSAEVDAWSGATITSEAIKKAVAAALAEAAVADAEPAEAAEAIYKPGVYEQIVRGMGGKITFQIEFSETAIVSITPAKHHETEGIGDRAFESVIPAIIEAQSAEVDAWSGATITSEAIKKAVAAAIEEAKLQ